MQGHECDKEQTTDKPTDEWRYKKISKVACARANLLNKKPVTKIK